MTATPISTSPMTTSRISYSATTGPDLPRSVSPPVSQQAPMAPQRRVWAPIGPTTIATVASTSACATSNGSLADCCTMPERGQFADHTAQSGLGGPTYQTLTFGTDFIDIDNDGYPDLFLANGHVEPNIEILDSAGPRYAQHDQLFLNNRDGTFTDATAASGLTAFLSGRRTRLSRGRLRQRRRCRSVRVEQQPTPAPAQKRWRQPRQLDFSRSRRHTEQSQWNRDARHCILQ